MSCRVIISHDAGTFSCCLCHSSPSPFPILPIGHPSSQDSSEPRVTHRASPLFGLGFSGPKKECLYHREGCGCPIYFCNFELVNPPTHCSILFHSSTFNMVSPLILSPSVLVYLHVPCVYALVCVQHGSCVSVRGFAVHYLFLLTHTSTNLSPFSFLQSESKNNAIEFGICKGRMMKGVLQLLKDAHIRVNVSERGYRPTISLPNYNVKLLKPQNILVCPHVGSSNCVLWCFCCFKVSPLRHVFELYDMYTIVCM